MTVQRIASHGKMINKREELPIKNSNLTYWKHGMYKITHRPLVAKR